MMAKIKKTSKEFSDEHFLNRSDKKNALAISSYQSNVTNSYEDVLENYNKVLENKEILKSRPDYWGGYSFQPLSFEFWEGNSYRLNRREKFILSNDNETWEKQFLQP